MTGTIWPICPEKGCFRWTPHAHGGMLVAPIQRERIDGGDDLASAKQSESRDIAEFLTAHFAREQDSVIYAATDAYRDLWQRKLDKCGAEQQVVALHGRGEVCGSTVWCTSCDDEYPCLTLRTLALPYAGDPDYREEWRP